MLPPWEHQTAAFEKAKNKKVFALFMEQRTGKSRVCVAKAVYHYNRQEIDAVMVVSSPSGVHVNWIADEFPEWMPTDVKWKGFIWNSQKADQVGYEHAFKELLEYTGLAVLSVNAEALVSETTRKAIGRFLKKRKVLTIGDESSFFANWTRRTRIMLNIAKFSLYRIICDGTPADEGPFDLFYQLKFLDSSIIGLSTFLAFKHEYAEMEVTGDYVYRLTFERGKTKALAEGMNEQDASAFALTYAKGVGQSWPAVKKYRNLDKLHKRMEPYSFRVLRADCFDMPEKIYQKIYVELSKAQRKLYDTLRDEYVAELATGNVTVAMGLTRALRLQQVACGYWPEQKTAKPCEACNGEGCEVCGDLGAVEDTIPMQRIGGDNPRLEALKASLKALPGPAVIWSRFRQDVDDIFALGVELGRHPVRYDGSLDADEKTASRRVFQAGESGMIVGNEASLQRGIRLDKADNLYGYANHFSLRMRRQVEDRAESTARVTGTGIIDLVARDTVDDKLIIPSLRAKRRIADMVMKDKPGAFL